MIDSARMQGLWSSVDMRGLCIGAAYWPLLLIYSVGRPALECAWWRTVGKVRGLALHVCEGSRVASEPAQGNSLICQLLHNV